MDLAIRIWTILTIIFLSCAQAPTVYLEPNVARLTVWEGSRQTIDCSVKSSEKNADLSWTKNPPQGGNFKIIENSTTDNGDGSFTIKRTLGFQSFSSNDSGTYTCTLNSPPVSTSNRQIELRYQAICDAGKYGEGCAFSCSQFCKLSEAGNDSPCHYINGTCLFGCKDGHTGANCSEAPVSGASNSSQTDLKLGLGIPLGIALLILLIILGCYCYKRHRDTRTHSDQRREAGILRRVVTFCPWKCGGMRTDNEETELDDIDTDATKLKQLHTTTQDGKANVSQHSASNSSRSDVTIDAAPDISTAVETPKMIGSAPATAGSLPGTSAARPSAVDSPKPPESTASPYPSSAVPPTAPTAAPLAPPAPPAAPSAPPAAPSAPPPPDTSQSSQPIPDDETPLLEQASSSKGDKPKDGNKKKKKKSKDSPSTSRGVNYSSEAPNMTIYKPGVAGFGSKIKVIYRGKRPKDSSDSDNDSDDNTASHDDSTSSDSSINV